MACRLSRPGKHGCSLACCANDRQAASMVDRSGWDAPPSTVAGGQVPELSLVGEVPMRRYKIVLHRTDEGISVSVPGLPGCWSEGDTEEEALENIRDAIQEYLAALENQLQGAQVREVEMAV